MFFSEKGKGAYLNDKRLRVSGRKTMLDTIYATGLPFAGDNNLVKTTEDLKRLLPLCAGIRRFGSASLDLAYVAAGRFDGFWERGLSSWDIAAGLLIVRESGGLVEAIDVKNKVLIDDDIIAGNGMIFDQFAKIIRSSN